ncbi:MAG: NAD(P)/FAD-dependent oxidoreductase [Solirubrobacteraceae bacterium]
MESVRHTPYWLIDAPAHRGGTAEPPEEVDVAVVGGGLTGLSAAIHLRRQGASVAVFERDRVGWGASGRNGGMCTGPTVGFDALAKRYDLDTAVATFRLYAEAVDATEELIEREQIDCDFKRWGSLVLAAKPAHYAALEAEGEQIAAHSGLEVAPVARADLGREIATDLYFGARLSRREAGLHPGKFVVGLASVASRLGAQVLEGTRVEQISRAAQGHVLRTPAGEVRARQVLVATNGYTDGTVPYFQRRIVPVRAASVVTEPLPEQAASELFPTGRMMMDTSNLITYFRLTPDRRLLIGGRAAYAASERSSDRRSVELYRRTIARIFPRLRDIRIDHAWSGLTGFTFHHMPHAGERDGIHYSLGYCGHGVPMGTYMGRQMALVMGGDAAANPWRKFKLRPIPMYFGTPWFLPLSLAYYRVKDAVG